MSSKRSPCQGRNRYHERAEVSKKSTLAFGDQVSQSDPKPTTGAAGGPTTTYSYDTMGDTLSLTDPDNNKTSWTYDGLGREIQQSETVALGYKPGTTTSLGTTTATSSNQYDLDGNLTRSTDADGRVNTYSYDSMNLETGETWYASAAAASAGVSDGMVSYSFDVEGNMLSAANTAYSDPVATYNYQYDRVGDVLVDNVELGDLSSADKVVLGSNYDYNGNRTSLSVNIGGTAKISEDMVTGFTGGTNDFTNSYTYDALGHEKVSGAVVSWFRVYKRFLTRIRMPMRSLVSLCQRCSIVWLMRPSISRSAASFPRKVSAIIMETISRVFVI
ncbi:MAG: RHS repeat domain-containing protein [Thermoguttaceae bacterium]